MGRPRLRPLLPSINRFLVGDAGRHSTARGVLDMRRARPERVRGDPRPFPWQGGHRGRGRRCGPPPPDSLQPAALAALGASPPPLAAARSEDVPPRFHDLVTSMVRSMVQWGVAAGVVTVVDGPNAVFRLHAQTVAAPVSHTPPRPRPRIRTYGVTRRARSKRRVCTHPRCRKRQHRRRR